MIEKVPLDYLKLVRNRERTVVVFNSIKKLKKKKHSFTVSKYVTGSIIRINYSVVPEHYELLSLACVLQSNDVDEELQKVCTNFLAVLAHTLVLDRYIPSALEAIRKVSVCPFWSARFAITEFIPVFVFHNMATIITKSDWIVQVFGLKKTAIEVYDCCFFFFFFRCKISFWNY